MNSLDHSSFNLLKDNLGTMAQYGSLTFEDVLSHGSFSKKENEIIAKAVASAFKDHPTIAILDGDKRLPALATLASELATCQGNASQASINDFLQAGYDHQTLAELMGKVAIRNTSQYLFGNEQFDSDTLLAAA